MSISRSQTLAQRFGFQDSELKTAQHDEIMLWLDENMPHVLKALHPGAEIRGIRRGIWEMPVKNKTFIVGFVDLVVSFEIKEDSTDGYFERRTICFEVKSKIDSLGELFRQLRMYENLQLGDYNGKVERICVICPDTRFQTQIKAQGFYFFPYVKNL